MVQLAKRCDFHFAALRCGIKKLGASTFAERLLVIAIIGVLTGLLVRAFRTDRDSGRITSCKNHVSRIAEAIANYQSVMGVYRAGG